MALPQEITVESIGLTVLNPELPPDQALVESVSQLCGDSVLILVASSSSMGWVDIRKEHGPTKVQKEIQSPTSQKTM